MAPAGGAQVNIYNWAVFHPSADHLIGQLESLIRHIVCTETEIMEGEVLKLEEEAVPVHFPGDRDHRAGR